jgi:hypothetical protein
MKTIGHLVLVGVLLLAGCASVGPTTITRDRFDYVSAISESWKRQTLLNLLKVRYTDAPVFMDVASVISSYSLEGEVRMFGEYAPPNRGDTVAGVSGTGRYTDKPTITYSPLTGDKFAKGLMAPIPISGFLFLLQSGYPADLVLRVCINSINGIQNAYGGSGNPREGDAKFHELMSAIKEAQAEGLVGFRAKTTKGGQTVVMFFRPPNDPAAAASRRIHSLLGLNPDVREFSVESGSFPENDREIAILTRSILQVMVDLASALDVPAADVADGSVFSPQWSAEHQRMFPALLRVRNGPEAPPNAYTAVRYRDHWFWIEDRDQRSKQVMSFLMVMFSLTEGAPTQNAPVVTVPAR